MSYKPTDIKLYNKIKSLADKKFIAPTSVYKSSWIVKEYKKAGGKYKDTKNTKVSGLKRWYSEKWVDLNRPIYKNNKLVGYKTCGRNDINIKGYPLCRPSIRINKDTPKTHKELSKNVINKAKKEKAKYTYRKNVIFKS